MSALDAMTARGFITLALKEANVLGVGQTALAEDMNDSFALLQRMTAIWQAERWMVPSLSDVAMIWNGAKSNTIGPGGYLNVPRPEDIAAGYFIQLNTGPTPLSFGLDQIYAYENYVQIAVKDLNSFPSTFYYDGAWPLGNIYVWPIPSAIYEVHFLVKSQLGWPTTLDSVFTLPDKYAEAVHYNLAIRLCSAFGKDPKVLTAKMAKVTLNKIKNTNAQVAELNMPVGLRKGRAFSLYNPDGYG